MIISNSSLGGKEMLAVSSEQINDLVAEVNQWHMLSEENT